MLDALTSGAELSAGEGPDADSREAAGESGEAEALERYNEFKIHLNAIYRIDQGFDYLVITISYLLAATDEDWGSYGPCILLEAPLPLPDRVALPFVSLKSGERFSIEKQNESNSTFHRNEIMSAN